MSIHGVSFDAAQRAYDSMEAPEYYEDDSEEFENSECEICIHYIRDKCTALGETDPSGDCPSFQD